MRRRWPWPRPPWSARRARGRTARGPGRGRWPDPATPAGRHRRSPATAVAGRGGGIAVGGPQRAEGLADPAPPRPGNPLNLGFVLAATIPGPAGPAPDLLRAQAAPVLRRR